MQELANSLIESSAQCWTCPVFDVLFAIISDSVAAIYQRLTLFSVIIFCVLFAFYIANAVWENIKSGSADPFLQKSVKPVIIKSLIALSLLSAGLMVPHLISTITLEPVAEITLQYSQSMLPADYVIPDNYQAIKLSDDGFFNPQLRDTLLKLIQSSISNFQFYIKFGFKIMDDAFSISALLGIGALIRHIIVFFIGMYLTYNFVRLFVIYSYCFMDIIVAMTMFAFFFPLSIVFFIFKDASAAPGWMKKLGGNLGGGQIKKLVDAIASVGATILTYTIIMLIISGYLSSNGIDPNSAQISTTSIFNLDLENSDAMQITFAGAIVLVYIIRDIADQIPDITKKVLDAFNVKQDTSLSEEMGKNTWKLTNIVAGQAKNLAKTIINPESVKPK
jgi:hypothetical protein